MCIARVVMVMVAAFAVDVDVTMLMAMAVIVALAMVVCKIRRPSWADGSRRPLAGHGHPLVGGAVTGRPVGLMASE